MIHRNSVVTALCLLANVGIAVADTQVQLLTKVFDAAYSAEFSERENIIESKRVNVAPLQEAMKSIVLYVYKNATKYSKAVSLLKDASDDLIAVPKKIAKDYPQELVTLTLDQWDFKGVIPNYLSDAREKINEAKDIVDKTKGKDAEIKNLLDHIVVKFVAAGSKIENDAKAARARAKQKEFTPAQAEEKAWRLWEIYTGKGDAEGKWALIMSLIGLDMAVSKENYDLALRKFGIIDRQDLDAGTVFKGKRNAMMALDGLYNQLNRQ